MRIIRPSFRALVAGLALGISVQAAFAAQGGFQLPPSPDEEEAQGPVVDGVPAPRLPTPSPAPAPAPTPSQVQEAPEPAPADEEIAPAADQEASDEATETDDLADSEEAGSDETTPPSSSADNTATAATTDSDDGEDGDSETQDPRPTPEPLPAIDLSGQDTQATQAAPLPPFPDEPQDKGIPWTLILLLLLTIGGGAGALFWWRRESTGRQPIAVPRIIRPRPVDRHINGAGLDSREVPIAPPPSAEKPSVEEANAEEEDAPALPLRVALMPRQMRITLVQAVLSYRLTLTNTGPKPMTGLIVRGDMISAHASLSREEQLANPENPLEELHRVPAIPPGKSVTLRGELKLPLPMIRAIKRDDMSLFVPLARLCVTGRGIGGNASVVTSVVGQIPPRGANGLQPFRLDLGARIYNELSQRAFA